MVLLIGAGATSMHGDYTPHWAVQIRGGSDAADRLAAKHGFINMGLVRERCAIYSRVNVRDANFCIQIANLEHVYDFKLANDLGDKREPMSDKTLALSHEPEVSYLSMPA